MVHTRLTFVFFFLILLCLLPSGPVSLAQVTNATLTGLVTDTQGAAVAGAHVQVRNIDTNSIQTVTANNTGIYTIRELTAGRYRVTTDREGFQKNVETEVVLTIGQTATLNIILHTGDVKQTVTVSGDEELINTTTAEISEAIDEHTIKELPLNGRDPSSLVFLSTGVTSVLNTNGGQLQSSNSFSTESGASAEGGRQGSTYYMLDGAPHMDVYASLAAPFPNADATQEFRVVSNLDARYGFAPGAAVSIQTKSGTNTFHGGAFEFLRNNDFNAADFFSHQTSPLKRNQFGAYVGGPIIKNKLLFFVNYQATRQVLTSSTNAVETPTQAMLNGDFTAVPQVYDSNGNPVCSICGTKVDPANFDAAAVKIDTTALPLGQVPANGLVNFIGPPTLTHYDEGTARLDYNINERHRLFLRSFTDYQQIIGGAVKGNMLAVVPSIPGKYFNEAFGYTWIINPSTINSLTVSWSQMQVYQSGAAYDINGNTVCLSKYINVVDVPGACYLEGFGTTGFGTGYNEPNAQDRTTDGISDVYVRSFKNHTFSAGIDVIKLFSEENSDYPATPLVSFGNGYTGFGLADFLYGKVSSYTQGGGELNVLRGWELGVYLQDQYRVRPNFILTAGVRWDPQLPPLVVGGRGSAFRPGQQSTQFPNAPLGLVFPGDTGINSSFMKKSYTYFEPRIGFSWQPVFLAHTAVRGGFAMYAGPLPYNSYNPLSDIAPFSPTFSFNSNSAADSWISFDNPWSFPGSGGINGMSPFPPFASTSYKPRTTSTFQLPVTVLSSYGPNFHFLSKVESWNLSIEQQFSRDIALHLAYVGSETYHLPTVEDVNPGIYVQGGNRTTYPLYGAIHVNEGQGTSSYESLQVGLDKHLARGLQAHTSFTWSKVLDLSSSAGFAANNGALPDPFDIRHNRGISDLNVPLISVTNFVYISPSLVHRNIFLKNLLGAWEISGIYTLQNGTPFGIVGGANSSNNSGAQQYGDRADVVPGVVGLERRGGRQYWLQHYITPGAFQANAPGTFGNSGKNIFTTSVVNTADAAIAKNWRIQEGYGLQFRWEMFNAFNHVVFGPPNNDPTSPTFGQITYAANSPRVMQGALKFEF